jgi:hypothetical protein
MSRCLFIISMLLVAACGNAGKTYATIEEARSVRLFERGWLPDILPPSSHGIAVTTDPYLDVANGSFVFDEGEAAAFFAQVSPRTVDPRWVPEWHDFVSRWSQSGYRAYTFSNKMSTWLFMCGPAAGGSHGCQWLMRHNT